MGPVKITAGRVAAGAAWCLILVETSLCRQKPATNAEHSLRQIRNYHSSSPILSTEISAAKWSRIFSLPFSRDVFGPLVIGSLV